MFSTPVFSHVLVYFAWKQVFCSVTLSGPGPAVLHSSFEVRTASGVDTGKVFKRWPQPLGDDVIDNYGSGLVSTPQNESRQKICK